MRAALRALAAASTLAATSTTTEWRLEFDAPVLAAGRVNESLLRNENKVQMLSNSLGIPCLFFSLEPYAKTIFSTEQNYGHGYYSASVAGSQSRPFVFSTNGGRHWNQSGCPQHCHNTPVMVPTASGPTWASMPQGRLLLEPEHQAFWPSDAPSTLRTVGADCLCACAGSTCAEASLRNKSGKPYGGCRREQVGPPPWHNFSSAYVADFITDPSNGSLVATLRPRRSLWYGLPRPVWPNCSKNDGEPRPNRAQRVHPN